MICRGNRRQSIFADDFDRDRYLWLLAAACRAGRWRVLAYCLMTNHVHLVLETPEGTLSRGMQLLSGRYAQAFNVRHGYAGHLFQGRFHAELVEDNGYGLELARYVDLNPVRAGAAARAAAWRWSSYRAHVGLERPRPFHDPCWAPSQLAPEPKRARRPYAQFVEAGLGLGKPVPPGAQAPSFPSQTDMSRGLSPGHVRRGQVHDGSGDAGQPMP